MHQRKRVSKSALALLTVFVLGCGSGVPKEVLVPVSGTVKVGGNPAAGVDVIYRPLPGTIGNGGSGRTDDSGKYVVMHSATQKPGIPVGKYSVHLSRFLTPDGKPAPPDSKPQKSKAKESMPKDWTNTTDVGTHNTVIVEEKGKTFDIDIQ
jgi:hypothetical protein